jgi:transcriptional regulator with XRE-family HTH domain
MLFLRKLYSFQQIEMEDFTGISNSKWSWYENDKGEPPFESLIKISDFFAIGIDILLRKQISTDVQLIEKLQTRTREEIVQGNVKPIVHLSAKYYKPDDSLSLFAEDEVTEKSSLEEIAHAISDLRREIAELKKPKK